MVAQAEPVEAEFAFADYELPDRAPVLLQMAARELGARIAGGLDTLPSARGLLTQLAAPSGRDPVVVKFQSGRRVRIALERLARLGHLERVLQDANVAEVGHAMMLEGLHDLELESPGVVRSVVLYLGTAEHEAHGAVGQVEADRHLGVAFVGAIAEPDEAAGLLRAIVKVVISAFVEIRLAGVRMHQVVLIEQDHLVFIHYSFSSID